MNDLLTVAIKLEENGEAIYRKAVERLTQKPLISLLQWMADEEASHGRWFTEFNNRLKLETEEIQLKKMVPQALQDMMGEKTLSLEEVDFSKITTVSELLEIFIRFEKDTILFYELLQIFIEEKTVISGLQKILQEEKEHVEKLTAMMALPDEKIL
jgi:rubrerythrin